ncbi:hypothetical protein [Legionella spiritensis]|nr:hypothetical protein [Legionella spiritensis]
MMELACIEPLHKVTNRTGKHVVFKSRLINADYSAQNKPDTNPTQQPDTKPVSEKSYKSARYRGFSKNADTGKTLKPDTPHNSYNLCVYVGNKFEKFWEVIHRRLLTDALLVFEKRNPLAHDLSVRTSFCWYDLGEEDKLASGRNVWTGFRALSTGWMGEKYGKLKHFLLLPHNPLVLGSSPSGPTNKIM